MIPRLVTFVPDRMRDIISETVRKSLVLDTAGGNNIMKNKSGKLLGKFRRAIEKMKTKGGTPAL